MALGFRERDLTRPLRRRGKQLHRRRGQMMMMRTMTMMQQGDEWRLQNLRQIIQFPSCNTSSKNCAPPHRPPLECLLKGTTVCILGKDNNQMVCSKLIFHEHNPISLGNWLTPSRPEGARDWVPEEKKGKLMIWRKLKLLFRQSSRSAV
jgi:hypothetical protein